MKPGLLEHIRTFVRTAETGSFTAVAREQGQSQPTVSRQIAALEEHLGVRLMQRSTRALHLTEEGQTYLAHAKTLLESVDEAGMAVRPGAAQVSGLLRIAAPVAFARLHLLPRLGPFLEAHPDLRTEWHLDDGSARLIEDGIDVAIRIGTITDPSLIARRIGQTRRVLACAPSYLEGRDTPRVPADLARHDCIVFTGLATRNAWTFHRPSLPDETIEVSVRVSVSASEGVRSAVLAGFGIALCPTWLINEELRDGRLVTLMPDATPDPMPIHAVMPSRRMITPRVRAFTDHIVAASADWPAFQT